MTVAKISTVEASADLDTASACGPDCQFVGHCATRRTNMLDRYQLQSSLILGAVRVTPRHARTGKYTRLDAMLVPVESMQIGSSIVRKDHTDTIEKVI